MSKCIKCGRELNTGGTLEIYSGMCGKCYEEQYDKFVKNIYGKYLFGVIKNPLRQQIDQLKQQLKEYKNKENTSAVNSWDEMLKNCENCGLNECIGCEYTQTCVQNIKQQLAEKQNTIDEINKEFVQAVHDWKTLCAEKDKEIKKLNWQLKDKDFIIKNLNHSLSVAPNANAGQRARIDELTKIVKEKDKEIEKLKQQYTILENENGKLTTELIMDKYKKAQKEVSFGKQLAIQELSEVERLLYESHYKEIDNRYYAEYEDIKNLIDSRIQALEELKGEKDVEG